MNHWIKEAKPIHTEIIIIAYHIMSYLPYIITYHLSLTSTGRIHRN